MDDDDDLVDYDEEDEKPQTIESRMMKIADSAIPTSSSQVSTTSSKKGWSQFGKQEASAVAAASTTQQTVKRVKTCTMTTVVVSQMKPNVDLLELVRCFHSYGTLLGIKLDDSLQKAWIVFGEEQAAEDAKATLSELQRVLGTRMQVDVLTPDVTISLNQVNQGNQGNQLTEQALETQACPPVPTRRKVTFAPNSNNITTQPPSHTNSMSLYTDLEATRTESRMLQKLKMIVKVEQKKLESGKRKFKEVQERMKAVRMRLEEMSSLGKAVDPASKVEANADISKLSAEMKAAQAEIAQAENNLKEALLAQKQEEQS